jgi:uncharacterized protein (DUF58 family)
MFLGRRRIRVTREGWYYLLVLAFILLGIVLRQVNLLVVLAGLMIGLFVFHWRLTAQMLRMVDVRRRLPAWICAGDPLLVELTLFNRRKRLAGWAIAVEDAIVLEGAPRRDGKTKVELIAPRIEAQAEARVAYRFDARRRGRYRFGPLRVSTRFPFGLVSGAITIGGHDELLVCPRLGRLSRAWSNVIEGAKAGQARTQHRKGLVDGEFYGLRDWRPGDSPRWIHWRTTAKLAKLSVRQFEQQRNRDVALVLDLHRPDRPSEADLYYVELAVSFAATAIADFCRRGGSRLLVSYVGASKSQQAAPASQIFMQDLLRDLAVIEAGAAEELPAVLGQVLGASRPGEVVIVISTRASQTSAALRHQNAGANGASAAEVAAWSRVKWIDVRSPQAARLFRLFGESDVDEFAAAGGDARARAKSAPRIEKEAPRVG